MPNQVILKMKVLAPDDMHPDEVERRVNDLITRGKQDVIKENKGKDTTELIIGWPLADETVPGFPDLTKTAKQRRKAK